MKTDRRWKTAIALAAITITVAACGGGGGGSTSGGSGGFDAEQYFRGKTIQVIVTHSAGGGSDLYGRFIATRLGDALPGKPRVTVTNVSGVGGMGDVFNAPADELVVGVTSQASALYTTVLDPDAKIDPAKIRMVGATGGDPRALTLFADAASSYDPLNKASGATGPELKFAQTVGAPVDLVSDSFFASWLCVALKAPCKMVSVADDDSTDINLMVQRGEVNTQLGTLITMFRDYTPQLADRSVKIGLEYAPDPNTKVTPPNGVAVPDVLNILPADAKADYDRILPIIGGGGVGKNFWVGPGTSDDVLTALRAAYSKVVDDPKNVEQLQSTMAGEGSDDSGYKYEVSAVSGEDAQKAYEANADSFEKNLTYYEDLQKTYYDQFWK
jgi:hypothetical protein